MSSPITKTQITGIVEMIRNWPIDEKLKWIAICEGAELILGYVPSRQALANRSIIVNAYKIRYRFQPPKVCLQPLTKS
jgi:hypothetical protein